MAQPKLLATFVIAAIAAIAPRTGHTGSIHHFPPSEAPAGAALAIQARVTHAWQATLTLHYRASGGVAPWAAVAFARDHGDDWTAVIPADAVVVPGVEYYIDAVADGEAAVREPQFASAEHPHVVRLRLTRDELRRERDLARLHQRRSRVHIATELVDYGTRGQGTALEARDRYYRLDADFAYRLLAYPLEQIRVGYTGMLGAWVPGASGEERAGFKVGGWFELRFGIVDGVALDTRGMVVANAIGFGVGGRAELRFGVEDGNHVAFGVEAIQDVGTTGHLRLGWDTVPELPMAATVEVTDLPSVNRDPGVRFVYDIAHPLASGLRIGGRIGYQARDAAIGGLSAGAHFSFDF